MPKLGGPTSPVPGLTSFNKVPYLHKNRPDPSGSYVSASFRFESKFESKVESEVKKDTHIRTKLNENENESENKNESGGTCKGGAKRRHVGRFTCFVFDFVFVLIYV